MPSQPRRSRKTLPTYHSIARAVYAGYVVADMVAMLAMFVLDMSFEMLISLEGFAAAWLFADERAFVGMAPQVDIEAGGAVEGFAAAGEGADVLFGTLGGSVRCCGGLGN